MLDSVLNMICNNMHYVFYCFLLKHCLLVIFPKPKVYFLNIPDEKNISILKKWVLNKNIQKDITTHWWYNDLDTNIKSSFHEISDQIKNLIMNDNIVESVVNMDEIYISTNQKTNQTSDSVFYTKHIDGPYYLFPLCSVYRFIYSINENTKISTHIDRTNEKYVLTTGDALGFDFNKEIHHIESNPNIYSNEPRITLKLHYVIYPRYVPKCVGRTLSYINSTYDINARNLFLYTLTPNTMTKKICAFFIIFFTNMTYKIEKYFGVINIVVLVLILFLRNNNFIGFT